jgi:diaminopimelate decarboxylase
MNLIGCSFHAGPTDDDFEIYEHTINNIAFIFDFAKSLGMDVKFVDIDDGYKGHDIKVLDNYHGPITKTIERHFKDPPFNIIPEPGQYFVTSSSKLICNIITKRPKYNEDGTIKSCIYCVNGSIYQSFVPVYIRSLIEPPRNLASNIAGRKKYPSKIYGISCDGTDLIRI